ncbi:hypothetical protein SEVIR_5G199050v4 [Setaria viridis]
MWCSCNRVHLRAQLLAAAAARACSTLANSAMCSGSGMTPLAASSAAKRSAHAASSGIRPASRSVTPVILSHARSHPMKAPNATSRYPGASPAKNPFPPEHSANAPSSVSSAANVSAVAAALSSSVAPVNAATITPCNCTCRTVYTESCHYCRPIRKRKCVAYLAVDVGGPEAGDGAVVGVGGEEGRTGGGEGVVEVLQDEEGLRHGPAAVEEDGDLLVDGVGGEEQLALVGQVLLHVLILEALEVQRHAHAVRERARPRAQHLQLPVRSAPGCGGHCSCRARGGGHSIV